MAATTEVSEFIDQLVAETRETRVSMLDCDFLAAVEAGTVTREQIAAWAKTFYVATRHGRLTIGNYYANSPDDAELRRELAENLYEEETGRISGINKCHMDVFLEFLAALGIGEDDVAGLRPLHGDHEPQGRAIAPKAFYVELAAYGLSVETPNAEFCSRIHDALRDNYGFNESQLIWFSMHAALDSNHGEEFKQHASHAADAPDGLERLRESTLKLSETVQRVWNGFGLWQMLT
jgi:pyrroloquinoline quinone (PQQ) biosynthesis protein C